GKNREILLRKRNELLDKLFANGTIDKTTCELSKAEQLPGEPKALPQLAPHLLDRFKKEYAVAKKTNKELATSTQTTIDINLQKQVNTIVWLHQQQLKGNQINNAAAMVMDVESGNVLAYIGNIYNPADAALESHVDVLSSVRSPGSTLKPILYAALLTEGNLLPHQLIPDIPTQIGGYTPQNFDLGYDGAVPANRALARSLNIPAVRMLQQYKYQRFYDVLKSCGITSLTHPPDFYGMSLILGGCEISPFELAGVYASMARMYLHQDKNNGKNNPQDWFMPNYMLNPLPKRTSPNMIVPAHFDYVALWHTFNAMNEVMRPGEEGLWNLFSSAQRIAWKTGTSFGFRDGWAIGLTPKYCVVVWVGNTTGVGRPDLTGINTAAPIMFDIFRQLPATQWFQPPSSGFMYIPVCKYSGYKAGVDCASADTIMLSESAKIAGACPYCRKIHLDASGIYRVNESCESPSNMQHKSWFVLPPVIEYYYKQKHPEYQSLPAYKAGCVVDAARVLDIIYPDEGAKIYVPLEINGERGKAVFKATHRSGNAKLFWHLDNMFIGTTQQFHQMAVSPAPGKHLITVVDEQGNGMSRNFEIVDK
ncbi:MAG: penicillin-binding protein 1C, partial [Chitinophagaceae bacterium]|nr:penicillin-binding protein 1C [Chitinophagaceae bacterium]